MTPQRAPVRALRPRKQSTKSTIMYDLCVNVDPSEFLNVRQAAQRLGIHENTVRNWVRQGLLSDARLPGSRFLRLRADEVERLTAHRGASMPSLQTERKAVNPELVSANQLKQWSATRARDAQENFPELVRRLLVETPGISNISVRSGDGVSLGGCDGLADSQGTAFLPAGHLIFEFGVGQNPKGKATDDYNKRISETPSDKSFVFMTPLRWAGGPAWAEARRAEGHFADVRVLDADDLEGWLRAAPGTHHWLSEHLGLRPRDAVTIDAWWANFSKSTAPLLPVELFTAGRSVQVDLLIERLAGEPQLTVVQSEWIRDGLAFIFAALHARDGSRGLPPAIVVSDADVWGRIIEQPGTAVLIPDFEGADVGSALDKGHQVICVIDRTVATRRDPDIALPRLDRRAAAEAIQSTGADMREADRLAILGRRSLPALVRRLSRDPRINRPAWATPPAANMLARLVLVGAWTSSEEDKAAVEKLTGQPWSSIEQTALSVSTSNDPVLRKVGDNWSFASPEEAFLMLRDSLTAEAVDRWRVEAQTILLEPDPILNLGPQSNITAHLEGVRHPCSGTLKHGLAQGLALMGAMGAATVLDHGQTLSDVASWTIQRVLESANQDSTGRLWHQMADILPLLAEAAPDAFLNIVEDDLDNPEPVLVKLFQEARDNSPLGPSSPHPHLLWALETVCWAEQHLIEGTRALARLAAVDPGGKLGNRPSASLASVLCGWARHTSGPLEVRLQALDIAYVVSETVGWRLIFDLWPSRHRWVSSPAVPRIRDDWRPDGSPVLMAEWVTFTRELVDRAIKHSNLIPERLVQLVEGLATVPPGDADRIIEFLEAEVPSELDEDGRLLVWEKLRSLIARHQRGAGTDWAMSADVCARLTELATQLEPQANPERFAYLFDWRPGLATIEETNHETYAAKLNEMRGDAIRSILDSPHAVDDITRLAQRANVPSQLGMKLAEYNEIDLPQVISWFEAENPALREAADHWVRRKMERSGPVWLSEALKTPGLSSDARQAVIRNVPARADFWEALSKSPIPTDEDDYWSGAPIDLVALPDTDTALAMLVTHGRAWSAVAVAANALEYALEYGPWRGETESEDTIATDTVINLLDQAVQQEPLEGDISHGTGYYVGRLLDYLNAAGAPDEQIVRLEFAFFRLLEHDRTPTALNRAMAAQPDIFVDMVKYAYRGETEPRRERNDATQRMAAQAWTVLNGWKGFPGQEDNNGINATVMSDWVRAARLKLSEADRADIGDELIGQTFAHCPVGADGIWPAEPVRDLIETIGSRELERGVALGRFNGRGVTSRGIYEGGRQEWDLAQEYREWSRGVHAKWPRTSRILRDLADSYERDARRHDLRAELHADEY